MGEVGVDVSVAPTTKLTAEVAAKASFLITMGCGDQCPVVPGCALGATSALCFTEWGWLPGRITAYRLTLPEPA
jgi:hypothetical protein